MVYDVNNQDVPEFTKEVVGSLDDFSIDNQWFMENLAEQLRQKCILVEHLQSQIQVMEWTIKGQDES
jgi:hypothetical protein